MQIPTISMPVEEARAAYREYRESVRQNPNACDQAIMLGYRALAAGKTILNLYDALRRGGLDEQNRPRLAFARADWPEVWFYAGPRGVAFSRHRSVGFTWAYWNGLHRPRTSFPAGVFDAQINRAQVSRAIVPLIPPHLRPANSLDKYYILWECNWIEIPGDPMLLRHLTGSLYAVLAVWDLTDLERAVLGAMPQARI